MRESDEIGHAAGRNLAQLAGLAESLRAVEQHHFEDVT